MTGFTPSPRKRKQLEPVVILLDVDGVLNTYPLPDHRDYDEHLHVAKVKMLGDLVTEGRIQHKKEVKIVLSSAWRYASVRSLIIQLFNLSAQAIISVILSKRNNTSCFTLDCLKFVDLQYSYSESVFRERVQTGS